MRFEDIDLDLLRCFTVIAETRSFTAAGERLGRSQSAISIRNAKLEEIFGGPLFDRNSRNVTLTERGRSLLPKARALLALGEETLASVRQPGLSGRLRVGILDYLAPQRLPQIAERIRHRLPDADIQYRVGLSSHLLGLLDRGEVDVTLAMHDPSRSDGLAFAEDRLVWAVGAEAKSAMLSDIVDLCLMDSPCFYRNAALEALAGSHRTYREVLTANTVFAVRAAVASGLGATVIGASSLGRDIIRADLSDDLPDLPAMKLALYGAENFRNLFVDVAKDVLGDYVDLL